MISVEPCTFLNYMIRQYNTVFKKYIVIAVAIDAAVLWLKYCDSALNPIQSIN